MTHATPQEHAAIGRAARQRAPRSSHAELPSTADRDPVDLLERQAATRIPELVPIRYGRMLDSGFSFFRGAAAIMAADLSRTPRSGLDTQLCGDAHLTNFGTFGTPERRLVFDLNDFDETLPGPWEWDVKRLAASVAVASRENGVSPTTRRDMITACVRRYRTTMREFAEMRNLDVWYAHMDTDQPAAQPPAKKDVADRRELSRSLARARTRDSMQAMGKLTRLVDGQRRIIGDPPLVVPLRDLLPDAPRAELEGKLRELVREYAGSLLPERRALLEQFRMVDIARKVVGVGSVGTRAWIVLLVGRDDQDPLFLQAKEAQTSVLAEYAGRSAFDNEGMRVVAGQRFMQAASDIFLGWQRLTGFDGATRDFYIRQLRDWKSSAAVETMTTNGLLWYAQVCGQALARAHARSGDRIAIAAYLGGGDNFDRAVTSFAEAYADQNERDYQALATAVQSGRVTARTGL